MRVEIIGDYCRLNDTTWPHSADRILGVDYKLRYGRELDAKDRMFAASVLLAYEALINKSISESTNVLRGLRSGRK